MADDNLVVIFTFFLKKLINYLTKLIKSYNYNLTYEGVHPRLPLARLQIVVKKDEKYDNMSEKSVKHECDNIFFNPF